ncbi:hypothetical protein CRM22_009582 [Opisthorchis felineus]|uniref:Ribosomal RNA-processing protein 8 n=1 Tax=Opisthorchis felineus TaxID=147828 RepID=A0A4S2L721_OPIFE|nr:hypothetical protein CRM22_009582 [Opisthorchis felineus]
MKKGDISKLQRLMAAKQSNPKKKKRDFQKRPKQRKKAEQVDPRKDRDYLDVMIKSSMFRFLNEKLYTCTSDEALSLFNTDKQAFDIYHSGFQHQLSQWPYDPLQWIVDYLKSCESNTERKIRLADMGCGDARLAGLLGERFKVYSFDLIAVNDSVTACDMAHTPLNSAHLHFVVFCLSLMGTNCRDFVYEANRLLKHNGELLIVDVASRFEGAFPAFLKKLKRFGFQCEFSETTEDTYFVRARLKKTEDCTHTPVFHMPVLKLNPCVYKKR